MKHNILGVMVDHTNYEDATQRIILAARAGQGYAVSAFAVDGAMAGSQNASHRARLNCFDLVAPDGRPIRWALWWLHGVPLVDRVHGPKLAMRVLKAAAVIGMPVYFYGSTKTVLDRMTTNLQEQFPGLVVAGSEPSKSRAITAEEKSEIAERIRTSGAKILFAGLGCPQQERFAFEFRNEVGMPILAVGAMFDSQADRLSEPPDWIKRIGLRSVYRRARQVRRAFRRVVVLNPAYLLLIGLQWSGLRRHEPSLEPLNGDRADGVVHA